MHPDVAEKLLWQIDSATQYISGSASNRIPYEIVYALDLALTDWVLPDESPIIATAISPDIFNGFTFRGVSDEFHTIISAYFGLSLPGHLVQMSLPHSYRHRANCPAVS
jgi:hypothetical protein